MWLEIGLTVAGLLVGWIGGRVDRLGRVHSAYIQGYEQAAGLVEEERRDGYEMGYQAGLRTVRGASSGRPRQ